MLLILAMSLIIVRGKEIPYYSNFNNGNLIFGTESQIPDFVTLANDPKANLPNDFTVCSSLFIEFMTTKNNFIEIFKKDGTHWFQMDLEHLRDYKTFSERISMYYGSDLFKFWDSKVAINPHSWYHICLGLDTVSGHLRIVINGQVIFDSIKELFINTTSVKPKSVAGKFTGNIIVRNFFYLHQHR